VNCAAIPLELFESEFFGHVRGAFTGATADSVGRFRLAHGGTLFLDEMTCLPPAAQAKLLRVLQDGMFERVGDPRPLHADVRVIAATNADVDAERAAGRFRQDLLYRLDVVRIQIPPLRQRRSDIPLLAARLLPVHASRAGRAIRGIAPETLRVLCAYDWPGNVRELQNVIERAVILERGDVLTPASLPFGDRPGARATPAPGDLHLRTASLRAEKDAIVEALRRSDGVRSEAARLLGIDPRNLAYYLRKHGIGEA
jgi:transcriptional regulator with GAF, ATPase, and Fis domain